MGSVARLAVVETAGLVAEGITPEDVATNLGTILDEDGAQVRVAESMAL